MADKPATPVTPPTEAELRAKFIETANKRSRTAIKAIAMVAKLPGKGRKPTDAGTIVSALRRALDQTEAYLNGSGPVEESILKD